MAQLFIEVTSRNSNVKHLINVAHIISVIEQDDGTAFIEFYVDRFNRPRGFNCAEGYEKVKCALIDIF